MWEIVKFTLLPDALADSNGTTTVNYAYDALGRRIQRNEGTETTNYHLNGKSDLEDYHTDSGGALTASYQRGADGLISETVHSGQTPVTSYYLYSPHGDTAALTDQNGAITQSYRYDSFGNSISGTPPRNGYTGKWQRDTDSATATIRMGVREYDPALGRFISADPLKGTLSDPQQRNRYTYTSNNPLVRYDLDGNTWYKPWTWFDDGEEEASVEEMFIVDPTPTGIGDLWDIKEDISGATIDFVSNYAEMKWRGHDRYSRYYHCKANYEATRRGSAGRATAWFLSSFKEEVYDSFDPGTTGEDKAHDYEANERGRNSCSAGISLEEACPFVKDVYK